MGGVEEERTEQFHTHTQSPHNDPGNITDNSQLRPKRSFFEGRNVSIDLSGQTRRGNFLKKRSTLFTHSQRESIVTRRTRLEPPFCRFSLTMTSFLAPGPNLLLRPAPLCLVVWLSLQRLSDGVSLSLYIFQSADSLHFLSRYVSCVCSLL